MKTQIEFINHASVLISDGAISLLSDPWYQGDAFHKGWNLICETGDEDIAALLDRTTHLWLSHEHPDHFSILFFRKFGDHIRSKGIQILFQDTDDKRVIGFLRNNKFDCVELTFNQPHALSDSFSVTCFKDGFYDSGLLIRSGDEKILNLNDCEVTTAPRAEEVFRLTGEVDVLLTQFSYAAWKGGPENKAWREDAAAQKLQTMRLQIAKFRPRHTIPFASFVYFSNEKNFYLNDSVNTPDMVLERLKDCDTELVFMKPGDVFGGAREHYDVAGAVDFWMRLYSGLEQRKLNSFDRVDLDTLSKSFATYSERVLANNDKKLMALIRRLSPVKAFQPVTVEVEDLNVTVEFDYLTGRFSETSAPAMLRMTSESLNFLFNNTFGFDTLTVNGCFEEVEKGGFILATKTLAIENLNNLGIHFNLSTLFNVRLIKLFATRLYRVARKLDA